MKRPKPNPPPPAVKDRPTCPACGKPLKPRINYDRVAVPKGAGFISEYVNHRWDGKYSGYGAFCTLRCCERYANAVHKHYGFTLQE